MSQASVQYAIKSTCLLQSIILCFSRTLRVEKFDPQFVDVCVELLIKVGPKRLPKLPQGVCAVLRLSNSGNRADYPVIAPRRMAKASQEDVAARERRRSRCLSALLNTFGSWGPELGRFVIYRLLIDAAGWTGSGERCFHIGGLSRDPDLSWVITFFLELFERDGAEGDIGSSGFVVRGITPLFSSG